MTTLRNREGFALIAVLWALVLLGVLAVQFHTAARADRQVVSNSRAEARVRWAARAGLARGLEALERSVSSYSSAGVLASSGDTVLPPIAFREDEVPGSVVVLDARARLNLNRVEYPELLLFLGGHGLPPAEAIPLAEAILDWRDPDAIPRAYGAEAEQYRMLGLRGQPRNGPFESVEELRMVRGFTPEIYRRLAPHLTVAGDGRINVNSASAPVLLTVPGMDASTALAIVERRRGAAYWNVYELLTDMPAPDRQRAQTEIAQLLERIAFAPRDVEIVATAQAPTGPIRAEVRAEVALLGGSTMSLSRVIER